MDATSISLAIEIFLPTSQSFHVSKARAAAHATVCPCKYPNQLRATRHYKQVHVAAFAARASNGYLHPLISPKRRAQVAVLTDQQDQRLLTETTGFKNVALPGQMAVSVACFRSSTRDGNGHLAGKGDILKPSRFCDNYDIQCV
ncbi:hypothetical protein BDV93DRAFT_515757 [Ceratobasidium sp. AG-I]|nr:hypothetical protein BDV93DRAFT_515757 [Ceratobasidium sp. AG-I]